jgi:hypothetical protein
MAGGFEMFLLAAEIEEVSPGLNVGLDLHLHSPPFVAFEQTSDSGPGRKRFALVAVQLGYTGTFPGFARGSWVVELGGEHDLPAARVCAAPNR